MTVNDPRIVGLTPESRVARRLTRTERAVSLIERSQGGGDGGGAVGAILVGDAAGGHLAGTFPNPTLSTTAAPQTARFGLGVAAHASRPLTVLGTSAVDVGSSARFGEAGTNSGVVDIGTQLSQSRTGNVIGATNAAPIVITTSRSAGGAAFAHGLSNGATVTIASVEGNTAANGTFTVANVTSTTFELVGSVGNGAYVAYPTAVNGGTWTSGRPAFFVTNNRDGIGSYRPIQLFARYQTAGQTGFEVNYQGISSILNYGESGGVAMGTPVQGTATAIEAFIDIYDNDHADTEYGGLRVGLDFSRQPSHGAFPTTTPGRGWTIDSTIVGPNTNPAQLLMGVVQLVQQQVASAAATQPSAAYTATARSSSLKSIDTVPADVGFLCVGTSGAAGLNTGAGYTIGFKVGGVAGGGGWLPYAQRSRIITGMQIEDYEVFGIKIQNRIDSGTGQAISLGWDNTGVASTSSLDGIDFGGDTQLFRKGVGQIGTAASDGIASGTFYIQGTAGVGFFQLVTQSAAPGTGGMGTDEMRIYNTLDATGAPSLFSKDDAGTVISLGKNWQFATTLTSAATGRTIGASQTITIGAGGGVRGVVFSGSLEIGVSNPNAVPFLGVSMSPTITLTDAAADLESPVFYRAGGAITSSGSLTHGNVAGITLGYDFNPVFADINALSSTATVPTVYGYQFAPTIDAGWQANNVRALQIASPAGTGVVTTLHGVYIASFDGRATTAISLQSDGALVEMRHAGLINIGNAVLKTLAASPADDYAAGLRLDPGYTGAFTVTRHNYIDALTPTLAASAVVTDACLVRFDAAAGTHKAVDAATTKTTPGGVDAWVKVNVNGTVMYVPAYTSKTA